MIPIQKGPAPDVLKDSGVKHAKELCDAYEADPETFRNGTMKMEILRSIYASAAVKDALDRCHRGKCCYCETFIPKPYADPHVEHWRPKLSSRQARDERSIWPGYYWLAYCWDNLLLSCAFCNRNNKRDLFPLEYPEARARDHRMSIEDERPEIIKPDGNVDPRDHIKFELDEAIRLTNVGEKTIEVLRLQSKFQEGRLTHFRMIQRARDWSIDLMNSVDQKARQHSLYWRTFVEAAVKPDQPYSAMVAAYLNANPLPPLAAETATGGDEAAPTS